MKKALTISIVVTLLVATIAGAACGTNKEKAGELPTLKLGNQWVYKGVSNNVNYELTYEVTDMDIVNGKECYVLTLTSSPPISGIVETATSRVYKETLQTAQKQFVGTLMNSPLLSVQEYSYTNDSPLWPLEVGKERTVTKTETTTTTFMGETETETETETYTFKVESIEEITVTAGTFKCFKLVSYDETGDKLSTEWYSDKVKDIVKDIDHDTGETRELKSYSV